MGHNKRRVFRFDSAGGYIDSFESVAAAAVFADINPQLMYTRTKRNARDGDCYYSFDRNFDPEAPVEQDQFFNVDKYFKQNFI